MAVAKQQAPVLEYRIVVPEPGVYTLTSYLLPTQSIVPGRGLRFALGVDDGPVREVIVSVRDGSPVWEQGVLNATVNGISTVEFLTDGPHSLRIYGTTLEWCSTNLSFTVGQCPEVISARPQRVIDTRLLDGSPVAVRFGRGPTRRDLGPRP